MTLLTYARAFAVTAATLEYSRGQVNAFILLGHTESMTSSSGAGAGAKAALDLARALCADIPSLNPVVPQIDRLLTKLDGGILPLLLYNDMEHLQHRIFDDLQDHFYYPVIKPLAAVYNNPMPFGEDVFNRFPSAQSDIINAGRCGILGQPTASVFHLMRVMEAGLRVLGREAGIDHAPSWEGWLRKLNGKFEEKHQNKSSAWKKKEPLIRDLCGDILAVKYAWRNPTMHIEREYTIDEAVQIYSAVQNFMVRLATKFGEKRSPNRTRTCPEIGSPVAGALAAPNE